MLKLIKQARAAVSMLNPDEVRSRAHRPVHVGLVAPHDTAFEALEEMLLPSAMERNARLELLEHVHRAGDPRAPDKVDVVMYHHSVPRDEGTYTMDPEAPDATVAEILHNHDDLALPLARQFPAFRGPVVDGVVQAVARENALFAIATALPNIVPSLIELPWAFGEFASDTAFLTANQIRMAFLIAGACGKEIGFAAQKAEVAAIVAGAFGWRALARELVGKIPIGGGLIPKGAIAYAGTYAVGKSLEYFHHTRRRYTRDESESIYRQAFERGRQVAGDAAAGPPPEHTP
jgi:uncharacterized protein (DUF697 family)